MGPMVLLHGGLGALALLAGCVAALAPKKRGLHVWAGRVFASVMLLSLAAISVPIVARANVFMLGLGTVAGFALVEGWRGLWRYRGQLPSGPTWVDRLAAALTGVVALGLGAFGAVGLVRTGDPLYAVCGVFAVLALVLVRGAVGRWREGEVSRDRWLAVHIGHTAGALGAAVTAAAIVNLEGVFGSLQWVLWVGPTLVSTVWARAVMRRRGLG